MKKKFITLLTSLIIFNANPSFADSIIGVVDKIVETANMTYKNRVFNLDVDSEFLNNSKLITSEKARLHATLIDGTSLKMGADSELKITEFLLDGKNDKAEIEVVKGAFRFISGSVNKNGGSFVVKSPLATLGVRGTDFWGNYTQDGFSLCLLDDGELIVTDPKGNSVVLDTPKTFVTITKKGISDVAQISEDELKAAWSTVAITE